MFCFLNLVLRAGIAPFQLTGVASSGLVQVGGVRRQESTPRQTAAEAAVAAGTAHQVQAAGAGARASVPTAGAGDADVGGGAE